MGKHCECLLLALVAGACGACGRRMFSNGGSLAPSPTASQPDAKVVQLVEIASISVDSAQRLLSEANGDLELAISLHFASVDTNLPSSASAPPSLSTHEMTHGPVDSDNESEEAEDTDEIQASCNWFSFLLSIGRGVRQSLFGIKSEDFQSLFEERYGSPVPRFSLASFGETVKRALEEKQLLLIWLHQTDGAPTDLLCKNILQNGTLQRILRRRMLLWAGDVSRFEPANIARELGVRRFPSLVLCEPLRGPNFDTFFIEWPLYTFARPILIMSPSTQGEGLPLDSTLGALLSAARDYHDAQKEADRRRAERIAYDRCLREEQDREFEECMLQDQLAAIRELEASQGSHSGSAETLFENGASAAALVAEGAAEADAELNKKEEKRKEAEADKEQDEETKRADEERRRARGAEILARAEPPLGAATVRLSVRLPSGERLQRTFEASQFLADVYDWVHCCRSEPSPLNFEICTTFPVRTLDDQKATLEALGLAPSAALVVRALSD